VLSVLTTIVACASSSSTAGSPGGDDSEGGAGADGGAGLPHGAVVLADGAIALPDGAVIPNDGAVPTGDSGAGGGDGGLVTYGTPFTGGVFNLGPVDYAETQWHNACAPDTKYPPTIAQAEGNLLAGLWNGIPNVASYCDACISVTTGKGKTAILRVVTYGDTSQNSIDVSPEAFQILDSGEDPRSMTWQFARCPDTGKIVYEFQTLANEDWTSLWVRNARVPITKVEVQSTKHASFVAMDRGTDGTLTDSAGFGAGTFTIRLTGMDGQQVTDTFSWPAAGIGGQMLTGQGNFN
jgi:expansin (peptidoglycan-binding protein)